MYNVTAHAPGLGIVESAIIRTEGAAFGKVRLMEKTHGPSYHYRITKVWGDDSQHTEVVYEN